jgi:hypothetical protein
MNILPFAVFIHCMFAFYSYGSEDIFPLEFEKDGDSVVGVREEPYDRLIRLSSGLPYLLLFILCLGIYLFNFALTEVFEKLRKQRNRKISAADEAQANFKDMEMEIREHGLASYSIMKNKKYRPLILALNSAAQRIKEKRETDVTKF